MQGDHRTTNPRAAGRRRAALRNLRRLGALCALVCAMAEGGLAQTIDKRAEDYPRIRFKNDRIAEVMRFAIRRSPTFRGLVKTIEASNAVVYVDEGVCRRDGVVACTRVLPTVGSRYLQIRIEPREGQIVVAQHLAHEFQHAVEILERAEVVDDAGVEGLYREIGYPGCAGGQRCWETPGAQAVEELVHRELVSSTAAIAERTSERGY